MEGKIIFKRFKAYFSKENFCEEHLFWIQNIVAGGNVLDGRLQSGIWEPQNRIYHNQEDPGKGFTFGLLATFLLKISFLFFIFKEGKSRLEPHLAK